MPTVRLAMWSGPRNISTALMRSFESRGDCVVEDEPLYAYYLAATGRTDHPATAEILAHHDADWGRVAKALQRPLQDGKTLHYQKHMAHHLLPGVGREWLSGLTHAFLIREPREMLTSLIKVLPSPTLADTGLPQQLEIFERMRDSQGEAPPVLDSQDVLGDPGAVLSRLCERVGIAFTPCMLRWEKGPRESDGVWAKHWYGSVWESTGFHPYQPKPDEVPPHLQGLLDECNGIYAELHRHRICA